jgi:hypothetical protein
MKVPFYGKAEATPDLLDFREADPAEFRAKSKVTQAGNASRTSANALTSSLTRSETVGGLSSSMSASLGRASRIRVRLLDARSICTRFDVGSRLPQRVRDGFGTELGRKY